MRTTTLRNTPCYTWFYRGLPGSYPIFHPFSPGTPEGSAHKEHNSRHTFGRRESLCASFSLIIRKVEPRAPSSCISVDQHRSTAGMYTGRMVGTPRVVQGGYIPGWCIPTMVTRVACTEGYYAHHATRCTCTEGYYAHHATRVCITGDTLLTHGCITGRIPS